MPRSNQNLQAVVSAAALLLERREDQMLTAAEWDALAAAVAACNDDQRPARQAAFAVEDGILVRHGVPSRGEPYAHRCPLEAFEEVAYTIDEQEQPFTLVDLQTATGLPFTQVAVSLAFLKERGCLLPVHGRKHKAASGCIHLDAMTEFHALRESAPGA